jgi:hypothetical protein
MAKKPLLTKNKFSMFEVRSLLQKAIRRNDVPWAGWAVRELIPYWTNVVNSCLLTVACEDIGACVTSDLLLDVGAASKGNPVHHFLKATLMLCASEKSRDTDNFIYVSAPFITGDEIENYAMTDDDREFATNSLNRYKTAKCFPSSKEEYLFGTYSIQETTSQKAVPQALFETPVTTDFGDVVCCDQDDEIDAIAILRAALRSGDKRMAGWACCFLDSHRQVGSAWDTVLPHVNNLPLLVKEEVLANYRSSGYGGAKKPRQECSCCLQLLKVVFMVCAPNDSYAPAAAITDDDVNEYMKSIPKPIEPVPLKLPAYVFDIHTIKGKMEGKTKNDFLFTENAALTPKRANTVFDPIPGNVYGNK